MLHLILLYMCPHTPLLYVCVLILLFWIYVSSYSSAALLFWIYVSSYSSAPHLHICVLILINNCRSGASASSTAAASEQAAAASEQAAAAWQRCRLSGFAHVLGELISVRNTSRCTVYYV